MKLCTAIAVSVKVRCNYDDGSLRKTPMEALWFYGGIIVTLFGVLLMIAWTSEVIRTWPDWRYIKTSEKITTVCLSLASALILSSFIVLGIFMATWK